jgi:hypothetical protein
MTSCFHLLVLLETEEIQIKSIKNVKWMVLSVRL